MAKATTTIRKVLNYRPDVQAYFAANQSLFNRVASFYFDVIQAHSKVLDLSNKDFGKTFWLFYRKLLAYRQHPDQATAHALRAEFDHLFTGKSGYDQLDEYQARTLAKKEQLLMVLSHPEILLHNNPAELGARQRVRKRDVSLLIAKKYSALCQYLSSPLLRLSLEISGVEAIVGAATSQ